jgi:hypothetical protein
MLVAGCGTTSREIKAGVPTVNTVGLLIRTHIKTHLESYYVLESTDSLHGKSGYPFVFNVDGRGVEWKVDGVKEETVRYDEKGNRIAEGGPGMRCSLEKKIRLSGPSKNTSIKY